MACFIIENHDFMEILPFLLYKMTFFASRQFLFLRFDTRLRSFLIQNKMIAWNTGRRERKSEKILENRNPPPPPHPPDRGFSSSP